METTAQHVQFLRPYAQLLRPAFEKLFTGAKVGRRVQKMGAGCKTFYEIDPGCYLRRQFLRFHLNLNMRIFNHILQFLSILGATAYDSVRSLSYQEADVFLVCYKISDPISLYNVKNKWIGEIRRHRPEAPVVLCGCQSDLRYVYLDCADVGNLLAY